MEIIKSLNDFAGLFALLALLVSILMPYLLYIREKKDKKKTMRDELKIYDEMSRYPFPMSNEERKFCAHKELLKKSLED